MSIPAYVETGAGPRAIVFLHGIGGGKEGFETHLDRLADAGWRAIAWDAPGYGQSAPLADFTWPNLTDSLARLLDHLKLDRVVLLGHSMGGMIAQEMAVQYPERLDGLVLFATSPAFGKPDGTWQEEFLRQRLAPLDAGLTLADLAPHLVRTMMGEAPDPTGIGRALDAMSRVPPQTYRAALQALVGFDRREALARIAVPTLVLAGERDSVAPPAMMERMAERIPGAVFRVVPGAGHLANFERPATFDAILAEFLASLGGKP